MTATKEKLTLRWRRPAGETAAPAAAQEEYVEVNEMVTATAVLVKAIQIQPLSVDPWSPPDPLDVCLECWKVWMGQNDRDLGTQRLKLLSGGDDANKGDEEAAAREAEHVAAAAAQRRDNEIAEATDAAINSLRACDRWAIYKMSGLASAWNFPMLDYMTVILRAKAQIEKNLRSNIATRALFG
jgi:hypothetical protein